jgi:hypothetical protein
LPDGLSLNAVEIAGKIDAALMVDVGSLERQTGLIVVYKVCRQGYLQNNWTD